LRRQGLVGAFVVVDPAPVVELRLRLLQCLEVAVCQDFGLEGAVKLPLVCGCRGRLCVSRMPRRISQTARALSAS
jgi:hypothetical protein